jgi:hypothetical protein
MATIGNLAVAITASTAQFVSSVGKASKVATGFGSVISGLGGQAALVTGSLSALVGSSLTDLVKASADAIVQVLKLARSFGTSTEFVAGLQQGIKNLGGDTAVVGTGLAAFAEKLTDASSGGAAAADVFKRLGLNAVDLAKLPLSVAFGRVADAIAAIQDPTRRAAAAYQIFGDSAAGLLPILAQGRAGLKAAGDSAKAFGASFSNVKASAVEEAAIAFGKIQDAITGVVNQIVIALAPVVVEAADRISKLGNVGEATSVVIREGFIYAAVAADGLIVTLKVMVTVVQAVGVAFAYTFGGIAKGFELLFALNSKLPEELQSNFVKGAEDTARSASNYFNDVARRMSAAIQDPFKSGPGLTDVVLFFDEVYQKANNAAKAAENLKGATGALAELGRKTKLFQQGTAQFDQLKTPLMAFQSSIANLNALVEAGAVSWDTYARGVAGAIDKLDKAHQLSSVSLPSAAIRGSTDAQSAIYRGEAQNARNNENPQDRIARILAQAAQIEQEQLAVQRQIAQAFQKQPNVALIP